MLSTTRVATLLGLLLPSVAAFAVPAQTLTPRVPWEEHGLFEGHQKRGQDGYDTGCNHGPSSRGCWTGDFNIDTDMDLHWPDTGKTVKVSIVEFQSSILC